jgi:hypothetical protein
MGWVDSSPDSSRPTSKRSLLDLICEALSWWTSFAANHVDAFQRLKHTYLNYCFSSGSSNPQKDSAFISIQPCFPPVCWIVKTAPSQKSMSLVCCWFYLHFYADFSKFVVKPFESLKISATFLGSYIVSHPAPLTATKQVSYIMAGPRGAQANWKFIH